jgi:beta-glucanase (GH16 family)
MPTGNVPGTWSHLILDSEFNGTSLPSPWTTGWFGSGITNDVDPSENDCNDPAQVTEANGELDLNLIAKTETCPAGTKGYATGIVTTNPNDGTHPAGGFQYTYGYAEARISVTPTSSGGLADWPSFWTDGQSWPTDGEDDILEGLGGPACWHFHDPSGGPGGCASGNYGGGWHTYGADWEPGVVTYYYDGVQVGQITSGITSSPMYLILGMGLGSTPQAPAAERVSYVRVWQH